MFVEMLATSTSTPDVLSTRTIVLCCLAQIAYRSITSFAIVVKLDTASPSPRTTSPFGDKAQPTNVCPVFVKALNVRFCTTS